MRQCASNINPRGIYAGRFAGLDASILKALEHSSSRSPSDSAAPQCRQFRADNSRFLGFGVAVLLIAGEVDDVAPSHYDFLNHCCPRDLRQRYRREAVAQTFSATLKF